MMHEQEELVSRAEVQEMIDAAIRRHNRNASIISMCVVGLFLHFLLKVCFDLSE